MTIRDAATLIILRNRATNPAVLMGMRGKNAVFMPNKFVFPGGAVDPDDRQVPLANRMNETCENRLTLDNKGPAPATLAVAAIRELWEETGLILGAKQAWPNPPSDWTGFSAAGFMPDASDMRFVFRAITPVGRPRRFDARFFLVDETSISNDLDDFSQASDELSHLQWIPLTDTKNFDLPFITQVVLSEITALVGSDAPPASVPFFKNSDEDSLFERLAI